MRRTRFFPRSSVTVMAVGLAMASPAFAQQIRLVSTSAANVRADGPSITPSVSADGRYVAFASFAINLVPNDTNGHTDIFVKDRQTGAIERVSLRSDGSDGAPVEDSLQPFLSADARFVLFSSYAGLTALGANQACAASQRPCEEAYLHDRTTGETTLVSVATDGTRANNFSIALSISGDGRYLLFSSLATNLAPGANDGQVHLYVRDRIAGTTTWIDRSTASPSPLVAAAISRDGSTIAFVSHSTTLDATPDPLPCDVQGCARLFVADRATGVIARVPITDQVINTTSPPMVSLNVLYSVAISADANTIAYVASSYANETEPGTGIPLFRQRQLVYDRRTHHTRLVGTKDTSPLGFASRVGLDGSGRVVVFCEPDQVSNPNYARVHYTDLVTGLEFQQTLQSCSGLALSDDANTIAFSSISWFDGVIDNTFRDYVYVVDRDVDRDGMADDWEQTYHLNPADPSDAALDPDGDGKTNLQEYQARTHPNGRFTRYLAEGAQNVFFSTDIALCSTQGATVLVRYLGDSGAVRTVSVGLSVPFGGFTCTPAFVPVAGIVPDASFSTVIESDQFVAVERTMHWGINAADGSQYGSSAETGIIAPSTTWYFAEGATHGAFDLFYLLQNPSDADTIATITYLLPAGQAPISRDYDLPAHSRRTIWVDQEPGLAATDVSARIVAGVPILAERSMYLSTPDQPFAGGTGGAGIPQPATKWFVAEGATGTFFDLYLLIGNPSAEDANVTVSYLLDNGTSFDKSYVVAKESRLTIAVKDQDPRLAAVSVSSVITSTNNVPIVVERSMWWPSPGWYEGHLTAGTTETATSWVLADGRSGAKDDTRFYVLVANPSDTLAHVTFDLAGMNDYYARLPLVCHKTVDVAPHSRYTADIRAMCILDQYMHGGANWIVPLAGTVTSDGPGIIVERSTYATTGGQFWSQGSSTALSKVPQP